jgi:flagellar hook-basal body complex protein FliE
MLTAIGANLASLVPELTGPSVGSSATTEAGKSSSFGAALQSALQGVDDLQGSADMQIGNLLNGAPNTDVSHVMVSVEKADVAFQLMMQVRNKIVSAYQDIEKMQF